MGKKIILTLTIILIVICFSNINVNAAGIEDGLNEYISTSVGNDYGFFYKNDEGVITFYRVSNRKIVGRESIDSILSTIKKGKYSLFVKAQGDEQNPFPNTEITNDRFVDGDILEDNNIYSKYRSITSTSREDTKSSFDIALDGSTIKVFLPSVAFEHTEIIEIENDDGSITTERESVYISKGNADDSEYGLSEKVRNKYIYEYNVNVFTRRAVEDIEKAVQEGIIAGSIETGFNVGSVYSEQQLPLNDIMEEIVENGEKFYKFKDNVSIKAGLDYFYNPIYGKMFVEDGIPQSVDEWNTKAYEIDITKGYIEIDSGYKDFVSPTSVEREGILEVHKNMVFTNGVGPYKDGLSTEEPKKLVNYNLDIGLPNQFVKIFGKGGYQLAEPGLYVLENLKMSVYNDTIYDFSEEERKTICTNKDIDLQRDYLVLYKHYKNGQPVGVVVVLKYSEAVIDTREGSTSGTLTQEGLDGEIETPVNDRLYITGRTIVLNNSYSDRLNIDEENRDLMAVVTKIHGSLGILPRMFAFPTEGVPTMDYMSARGNHRAIEEGENMSLLINFMGSADAEDDTSFKGFFIVRNNMYVQDGQLLDWLTTAEAQAMPNVKAKELGDIIRGVFQSKDLTFFDWLRIKDIEGELSHYKNTFLYRVTNISLIVIGTFMIVLGILMIFAYWFDIFNTFTEFSILSFISFGSIYPVASEDIITHMSNDRKYVTFKGVMLRASLLWIIGVAFFNNQSIIETIIRIYMYVNSTIGGL